MKMETNNVMFNNKGTCPLTKDTKCAISCFASIYVIESHIASNNIIAIKANSKIISQYQTATTQTENMAQTINKLHQCFVKIGDISSCSWDEFILRSILTLHTGIVSSFNSMFPLVSQLSGNIEWWVSRSPTAVVKVFERANI